MHVTTADPFASVIIETIDDATVSFRPDRRGHLVDEPWFWWAFRLHPHGKHQVVVACSEPFCFTSQGVAIRIDDGDWQWTGPASMIDDRCQIDLPPNCDSVAIAMSMPYQQQDWQQFVTTLGDDALVQSDTLTTSHAGRPVELLRLGSSTASRWGLLTCRHHACEASASWALEGFIQQVLTTPTWRTALDDLTVMVVPLVDTDGVADSQHGKNRAPYDHNRDYQDGRYPEVTAIKELVQTLNVSGSGAFAVDFHAPWISGQWNEHVYIVGSGMPQVAERQRSLNSHWEHYHGGSLPFSADGYLPYGTAWNTGPLNLPRNCSRWVAGEAPDAVIASIEFPYANVDGVATSPEGLRELGRSLAMATLATINA